MPLPFAALVGWLIGLGLAWAGRTDSLAHNRPRDRHEATRPDAVRTEGVIPRSVALAIAFAALVYAPIVGYFTALHGDWAYLYVARWHTIPSAVDLILVVLASASIPVAAAIARPYARAARLNVLVRLGAGPAVLAIGLAIAAGRRLATSATYAQYHGGFGVEPLTSSSLGRGVLLAAIALVAGVAWTVRAGRSL